MLYEAKNITLKFIKSINRDMDYIDILILFVILILIYLVKTVG